MRQRSLPWHSFAAFVLSGSVFAMPAYAQHGAQDGEWRSYGGDVGSTKYSSLDQINEDNFDDLEIVWRWVTVDRFLSKTTADGGEWWTDSALIFDELLEEDPNRWREGLHPSPGRLRATPLMADGLLYVVTPLSVGAAIDAETGETIWVHNPKSYETGTPEGNLFWNHRGAAYWDDGGEGRVFWGTGDGHLICVDAKSGQPCADFGEGGRVDLMDGLPRADRNARDFVNALLYSNASPPIVVRDVVISGSSIADRRVTKEAVPGWVRAYDVRTGVHKWDFHTVPASSDEFGADTWEDEAWRYSGNTNVWSMMSGDDELGYVYLPTGTATNDYYGGHRLGDNLFAESIIAVDVETGDRVWHFQAVHHGLWDYDFPAAPNVIDITVDGREIKALAQVSKQGFTYVFDRVTGEPVWPIEERPVPTHTNFPGERPAPTQPFPTKPPPFEYHGVTIDDLVDFTPALRQEAIELVSGFKIGPLFTPQSLPDEQAGTEATIQRPGIGGGANWSGAAVDPETGILYVPSNSSASAVHFYTPGPELDGNLRYTHTLQRGAPRMPSGVPLFKPPYSRITAIDLNEGEHVWMVPAGAGDRIRNHELLKDLNLPPVGGDGRGGPLLTKTLLINALTAGGTDDRPRLVAWDKATGELLASVDLPRRAMGTPMTYMLDGKQYIALTITGGPPELIAFALP